MRKILFALFGVLILYSCNDNEVLRIGYLDVDVRYTGGASQWEIDGVRVAFRRINTDNLEQASYWIDKTGKQRIELPFGQYKLVLNGNRCRLVDTDSIVTINSGEPTPKVISIVHLGYSVVVLDKGKEIEQGDTVRIDNIAALDICNKYSSNELKWEARVAETSWINLKKGSGSIAGNTTDNVVFEVNTNNENFRYGDNYDRLIITTEDKGS